LAPTAPRANFHVSDIGTRLIGVVLNDVNFRHGGDHDPRCDYYQSNGDRSRETAKV